MARKRRVQFPGAIYHIVTRGDGRRTLFHDPGHYERFTEGLEAEVQRSSWQVMSYCWMPNHIHLLVQTPEPNLSAGMQHWLSGYANWYAKRNRRTGHLFQGRYKAFQVEDDSYFWTLSRYIHLNPCVGKNPLVDRPQDWPYSSYPGYAKSGNRQLWVDNDRLLTGWRSEYGGSDPVRAYRKFVTGGLDGPNSNPLSDALDDWVIGSKKFLRKIVRLADEKGKSPRLTRRSHAFSAKEIIEFVAVEHGVEPSSYFGFRSQSPGRDLAALLCRELTRTTLSSLSDAFGLNHPDSSANLVRRAKKHYNDSAPFRRKVDRIKKEILKTENQV